jgi:hypothetical protein
MTSSIRVRVETTMMGATVGEIVTVELTPLTQAAIDDGRLTPVPADDQPTGEMPELKGEALDQALRDRQLSTSGTAAEKRARLAENPPAPAVAGLDPEGTAAGGAVPGAASTPAPAPATTTAPGTARTTS